MSKRNIGRTVGIHALFWGVIVIIQLQLITYNSALAQTTPTPAPFLGPIYYNRQNIYNIIDHNKPLASTGDDGNDIILHYNGVSYAATPMPDNGYGYDEHGGIDYSLKYVPVLAAANGTVIAAGWEDPSNHRGSYGLRIRIDHGQYDTIYGHLSVLTVATGDPVEADPEDRNSIIGISGNTGAVFGGCGDVGDDPTCGAHLHFEVRDTGGYRPVNPYGWIGLTPMPSATPVIDPWATDPAGATSYDLWQNEPAIFSSSHQYPGGTPVIEPAVNNARMIIDDGSADFSIEQGDCWLPDTGNESYNFGYHVAFSNDTDTCIVRWNIKRDAFTPPGDYDIFVHIPQDVAPSLGARYTIHHNQAVSVAIVVQAAYVGNEEHNAWAYLGRYDFAMNDIIAEYITLNDNTLDDDDDHFVLADAIMLAPAANYPPPSPRYFYISFSSSGYAGNVAYADEDVLLFDAQTGEWRMFFDGSDVGLSSVDVDAIAFHGDNLYFSIDEPFSNFLDTDIIRFTATSLGEDTSGTLSVYRSGLDVGMDGPEDDIDALSFSNEGGDTYEIPLTPIPIPTPIEPSPAWHLILSTIGQTDVGNKYLFEDEDLFTLGESAESAQMFLDGSEVGLNDLSEGIDGIGWDQENHEIYLSTAGAFAVAGSSGDGADIFVCVPDDIGDCTFVSGLFWNGSAHGIQNIGVDALALGGYIPLPGECGNLPLNCSFEEQFAQWTVDAPYPQDSNWLPSLSEHHSGWYSAMAEVNSYAPEVPYLISSSIPVQPVGVEYRFSFYGKASDTATAIRVGGHVYWYNNDQLLGQMLIGVVEPSGHTDWTLFATPFACPWPGANRAVMIFEVGDNSFVQDRRDFPSRMFIDDVKAGSRPNANCPTLNSGSG